MDEIRIQDNLRPPALVEAPSKKTDDPESRGFGDFLRDSIGQVNRQIQSADHEALRMAAGEGDSIHEAMIGLEKASISLQFMIQVRNKVVEAYHEIMRMQI